MSSTSATVPPPPLRFRKSIAWLTVLVPFVVTVAVGGPTSDQLMPHGTYHLVYAVIVAGAIAVLWRWRTTSTSAAVRKLTFVMVALQGLAIIGHLGEWASTLSDGHYVEDTTVVAGDEGLHTLFAAVTVPALVLSILTLLALSVVAVRQGPRLSATH